VGDPFELGYRPGISTSAPCHTWPVKKTYTLPASGEVADIYIRAQDFMGNNGQNLMIAGLIK
jgi:hypothetical protein